jgi:hypothetical protein
MPISPQVFTAAPRGRRAEGHRGQWRGGPRGHGGVYCDRGAGKRRGLRGHWYGRRSGVWRHWGLWSKYGGLWSKHWGLWGKHWRFWRKCLGLRGHCIRRCSFVRRRWELWSMRCKHWGLWGKRWGLWSQHGGGLWVWRLWGSFHWRCSVFWPRRPSSKCPCVFRREPSQPAERPGAERARRGKVRDGVVPGFEVC